MARGFIPHNNNDGRVQPWEYLPATGSTAPSIGLALVLTSGKLAKCGATATPQYICMRQEAAAVAAGTLLPVIKVEPDMVFECTNSASLSGVSIGQKVTLHASSGLQITGTTTSGVARLLYKAGDAAGSRCLVCFD